MLYSIKNRLNIKRVGSDFVLKELKHQLNNEQLFQEKQEFLKNEFQFVKATPKDYDLAREPKN